MTRCALIPTQTRRTMGKWPGDLALAVARNFVVFGFFMVFAVGFKLISRIS